MVRCSNVITRIGNKENDIKFFKQYLPLDVKTVVEPFAGSFAVIKHFYVDLNKYDFHINDNDETLHYLYHNPQALIDMRLKLSKLYIEEYKSKEYDPTNKFKNVVQGIDMHDHLKMWILKNMFIRGSLFKPISSDNFNPNEINILKNALITKLNYTEIFDLYRDDPNAFLFLDPPYLYSDNSTYDAQCKDTDMTQIIVDILEYFKVCRCKVMLVINKLYILSYLFKDYIKGEYSKTYQISKKKSIHLVICNYDQ